MDPENPDPFGGTPDNWSLPDPTDRDDPSVPWPPTDPVELAALNRWMDERELDELEIPTLESIGL